MECSFCGKTCKNDNSLRNHERLCKQNPDSKPITSNFVKYNERVKNGEVVKKHTNQFTKAVAEDRIRVVSEHTRQKLSQSSTGKKKSPETIEKLKRSMRQAVLNNPDSYTASNISGRTPIILYNGVKLKGSWELIVAKWLDSQYIEWTNVIDGIEYEWNGSTHLYYPDFYLPTFDRYIEVKGYERPRDLAKWSVVDGLIVLKQTEIVKIQTGNLKFEDVCKDR